MRKILLASAALVLSAGSAWAVAPSASVTIQTTVPATCSAAVFDGGGIVLLAPVAGAESSEGSVLVTCNGDGTGDFVRFTSTKGGVQIGIAGTIYPYEVHYGTPFALAGTTDGTPNDTIDAAVGTTVFGSNSRAVKVAFPAASLIASAPAGTYDDTLTVSIAP